MKNFIKGRSGGKAYMSVAVLAVTGVIVVSSVLAGGVNSGAGASKQGSTVVEAETDYSSILYTGEITEGVHITGVTWGEGHYKTLNDMYQAGFPGDLKKNLTDAKSLTYEIGMLDRPWWTYMNFNDADELYRIDMSVSERVTGEEAEEATLKFLVDLLDGLYDSYGLHDGYLYPTESTADFTVAYKDLSTAENLDLFQANDFLSVSYKKDEMAVWVVVQREDYDEEKLDERTPDILLENELPYILGEKKSPGDFITVPDVIDKYHKTSDSLTTQDRDSLYSVYIGFLNTRFEPPAAEEMEIIDETGIWPQPVLTGDVPSDLDRIDNDKYILENYKK